MYDKLLELIKEFDNAVMPIYKANLKENYKVEKSEGDKIRAVLREQSVKLYKQLTDLGFVVKQHNSFMKKYHDTGLIESNKLIYIKMDDCTIFRNYNKNNELVDLKVGDEFSKSMQNARFNHHKHWLTVYINDGKKKVKLEYSDRGVNRGNYLRLPNGKISELEDLNNRHVFKEDYKVSVNDRNIIKDLINLINKNSRYELRGNMTTFLNYNVKGSNIVIKVKLDKDDLIIETETIKVGSDKFLENTNAVINSTDEYNKDRYYLTYKEDYSDDSNSDKKELLNQVKDYNSIINKPKINLDDNGILIQCDNNIRFSFPRDNEVVNIKYELVVNKLSQYRKDENSYKQLVKEILNLFY